MVCIMYFILAVVLILHTYLTSVDTFQVDRRCECGQKKPHNGYMIIYGGNVESTEHPWLATIYYQPEDYLCGGSIITDQHILTAAHCFSGFSYADLYTRVGQQSRDPADGKIHLFSKLIIHPSYRVVRFGKNDEGATNDIAIGTLADKIKFRAVVWPICLNDLNSNFTGRPALLAGWGSTNCLLELPTHLQQGDIFLSEPKVCKNTAVKKVFNSKKMLCTHANHASPYRGDSGGPLIYHIKSGYAMQIGIVSFSDRCFENATVVFTKISAYYNWIVKQTENARTCETPL